MKLGYIGLGKMGYNHVMRLHEEGHEVTAWNRSKNDYGIVEDAGVKTAEEISDLVDALGESPRVIWIMVTSNAVDEIFDTLVSLLGEGDIVIDGGNSFYKDTIRRGEILAKKGIRFLDVGVSGGPAGARDGACLMIGGDEVAFNTLMPLFKSSSAPNAFAYMGDVGAGHYTKMVHNGIEYGMMQALAEGMNLLRKSDFNISVTKATDIYNKQSVITSRLVGWAYEGFKQYGEALEGVKGSIDHTGEGKWTIDTANEMGEEVPVISTAFQFRVDSQDNPTYTGRVVSMLRNMFGGHSIK